MLASTFVFEHAYFSIKVLELSVQVRSTTPGTVSGQVMELCAVPWPWPRMATDHGISGDTSTAFEPIAVGIVLGLALQDVHPGAWKISEPWRTACGIVVY